MNGWIRLHRSIMEHWIFQDAKKLKWWLTILMEVNHADRKILQGSQLIHCKRGESVKSVHTWAKQFNCTPKTVRYFLSLLQKDGMVEILNDSRSTHLKVCNYDIYQSDGNIEDTQLTLDAALMGPQARPINNNIKNEEEGKKRRKIIPPSQGDVISFFLERGYKADVAERAFESYNVSDWVDSKGNKILNWKQKMIQVWMRPENKEQAVCPSFGISGRTAETIK
jgi:hypothetical protein